MRNGNRTWAEVSLDKISYNYKQFRNILNENTKIMGIIKADAYGHGALEVARTLEGEGVNYFGVACFDEAKQLRNSHINTPILILGSTAPEEAEDIVKLDITSTIFNFLMAKSISNAAQKLNKIAKVHVKVDTGMCRIGYQYYGNYKDETLKAIEDLYLLPNIEIEGIYSHFSTADEEEDEFTKLQFDRFCEINQKLEDKGKIIPIKHICNSSGAMRFPQMHLDMVRIGICLYGIYPSDIKYSLDLKPAMELKTTITNLKIVPKGESISYGGTYKVTQDTKIATIPIGYADGFSRILSGKAKVIVGGNYVDVVGKICMDQCMIDVTNVNNIFIEEEVTVFGEADGLCIPADTVAANMNTITYELLTVIGMRVPRYYLLKNALVEVKNYLITNNLH